MGNRVLRLGLLVVAVAIVLVGVAGVVSAQRTSVECANPKYDLDGSGGGFVTTADLSAWKTTFRQTNCNELGAPVQNGGCSPALDLDGDGYASRADLDSLISVYQSCRVWVLPGSNSSGR
jgi:hypothetical protein